ncbi:hypothetical protein CL628_00030 [bacterium]|nr:hypothetical protein [bacterium]|tara:strand:+ start:101 stop:634 length:534 start_codon:yes stop_codon:yes gene_type:complete
MIPLLNTAIELTWLFLPGIAANLAPVFATHFWPARSRPIWESGLGKNKTWRGILAGLGAAILVGAAQFTVADLPQVLLISLIPATTAQAAIGLALALGAAALFGDAVESYIKRRRGKEAGHSWLPWDQIDFAISMVVVVMFVTPLSPIKIIIAIALLGVGSYIASSVGVVLGLKRTL